jgi:hypothetical protein
MSLHSALRAVGTMLAAAVLAATLLTFPASLALAAPSLSASPDVIPPGGDDNRDVGRDRQSHQHRLDWVLRRRGRGHRIPDVSVHWRWSERQHLCRESGKHSARQL